MQVGIHFMVQASITGLDTIKVLLVDDQALFCAMLCEQLKRNERIEVVGQATCGEEALDMAIGLRPHVVLLDIEMPGMVSFDAAKRILDRLPDLRVLVLSAFPNDFYIDQALAVNARGFLTKQETPDRVVDAVLRVAAGELCFSKDILSRIVIDARGPRLVDSSKPSISILSPREMDVLRLIAIGYAKKQIASELGISVSTVENHTARVMRKLNIHDRVELTRFAIREKIVPV